MSVEGNVSYTSLLSVLKGKIRSLSPYSVDKTLSVDGACADAKATGEALANRVKVSDIADNLKTNDPSKVLSAKQGLLLNTAFTAEKTKLAALTSKVETNSTQLADVLKNASSASKAAEEAKAAAEEALEVVSGGNSVSEQLKNSLQITGGKMTGALEVNYPTEASHAASKEYVDNQRKIVRATLYASQWLESSAPYTQTIDVEGVTSDIHSAPHVCLVLSDNPDTAYDQMDAFSCVSKGDTQEGKIKFTCFEEKPANDITLQIEVHI